MPYRDAEIEYPRGSARRAGGLGENPFRWDLRCHPVFSGGDI